MNLKYSVYSQTIGPIPVQEPKVEVGTNIQYPKDTYDEYYGEKGISIPWGWIIFSISLLTLLAVGLLFLVKKLKKKDRDEKA